MVVVVVCMYVCVCGGGRSVCGSAVGSKPFPSRSINEARSTNLTAKSLISRRALLHTYVIVDVVGAGGRALFNIIIQYIIGSFLQHRL